MKIGWKILPALYIGTFVLLGVLLVASALTPRGVAQGTVVYKSKTVNEDGIERFVLHMRFQNGRVREVRSNAWEYVEIDSGQIVLVSYRPSVLSEDKWFDPKVSLPAHP